MTSEVRFGEQARQDTALMWIPRHDGPPHVRFAIDPDDHPFAALKSLQVAPAKPSSKPKGK